MVKFPSKIMITFVKIFLMAQIIKNQKINDFLALTVTQWNFKIKKVVNSHKPLMKVKKKKNGLI